MSDCITALWTMLSLTSWMTRMVRSISAFSTITSPRNVLDRTGRALAVQRQHVHVHMHTRAHVHTHTHTHTHKIIPTPLVMKLNRHLQYIRLLQDIIHDISYDVEIHRAVQTYPHIIKMAYHWANSIIANSLVPNITPDGSTFLSVVENG